MKNVFVQNLMEQFLTSIPLEFASNIYHKGKNSLEEAKKDQYKMLMIQRSSIKKFRQNKLLKGNLNQCRKDR